MEFALARKNPLAEFYLRLGVVIVVVGEATILPLFWYGAIDGGGAAFGGVLLILLPLIWWAGVALVNRGVVTVGPTALIVRSGRWRKEIYRWESIANMGVVTLSNRPVIDRIGARILGLDMHEPFVEVRLRRSRRIALWPTRQGTDVTGIPGLGPKRRDLFVSDPYGLLEQAEPFLKDRTGADKI